MKLVKELFSESLSLLEEKKILCPKKSLERLLGYFLDCNPSDIYLFFEKKIDSQKFRHLLEKRLASIPVEYILEIVSFYNLEFKVTPDVLIPRVETELLVDLVIKDLESQDLKNKILWDVCTGSGCIGISIKKRFPELCVVLSDICPRALDIAKENAKTNNADVKFMLGNFLEPFLGLKADFVVSNPPYISEEEFEFLDQDVKNFEPKKALVAVEDGLNFYKRFKNECFRYLNPKGKAFFEIGFNQKKALENLFFEDKKSTSSLLLKFIKDYSGQDRFFFLDIE